MISSIPVELTDQWPVDGTHKSTTIQVKSGPGNNGIQEVLHIRKITRPKVSLSDAV